MNRNPVRLTGLALLVSLVLGCGISGSSEPSTNASEVDAKRDSAADFSFEDGVSGWNSWGGATVRLTRSDVMQGNAAASVSTSSPVPYGIASSPAVGYPRQGDRYTVSAWVKSADRPKEIAVRLVEVGGDAPPEFSAEALRRITRRWRSISASGFVQRVDRGALHVSIAIEHSIGANDGFLIDGVKVLPAQSG
jgi:hypothetical protein